MWNNLTTLLNNSPSSITKKKQSPRLKLEQLEDRVVPAVDVILEWNAVIIEADRISHSGGLPNDQPGPTNSSRAMAIAHAAMFDAFNSIERRFEPYLIQLPNSVSNNANVDAAVAKAARDVLVDLYPSQRSFFDARLTQTLRRVPDGTRETRGINVGRLVAEEILEEREDDLADQPLFGGTITVAPGFFQNFPGEPGPGGLSPLWGNLEPFAIDDVDNFLVSDRVGRTVAQRAAFLRGVEYAQAYNQLIALGSDGVSAPTLRTQDQTYIGIYWGYDGSVGLGTPPRLYNQIVREIAIQEDNTVAENARLFALVNLAQADAGIAIWGAKWDDTIGFDFWRPIRGIRQVSTTGTPLDDGNPFTTADSDWTPLGAPRTGGVAPQTNFTPPFPAYTSGHSGFGAAVFKAVANFYQTDNIPFTFISDELNGVSRDIDGSIRPLVPRSFDSLSEAAAENAASRVFLGIHWRFDLTESVDLGNRIADFVYNNTLRPRSGGGRRDFAIPDSNFESQIDAFLNNTYQAPPAPPAPPAPLSASLADSNLVQGLNTSGNTKVTTNVQLDRFNQRLITKLTRANDRLEILADRLQQRAENATGKTLARLQQLEDLLRDKIFANQEMINRLDSLV